MATGSVTSRRGFLRASALAGAAAGAVAVGADGALAAPRMAQIPPPPPVGAEIPMSMLAVEVPLRVGSMSVEVDFEGEIRFRVTEADAADPWNLTLEVIAFGMAGRHEDGNRVTQDHSLGQITIEQSDTEDTPDSLLKMVSQTPPRWEQTMFLDFTMTIENPPPDLPGGRRSHTPEPLVLSTKEPAKLIGELDNFPPKGEPYQLANPIQLVLPDNPEQTIASVDKFPVKVSEL
ncbi:twin-arginine translocation signal domain-containing protein [Amycolatopsis arida]|nr:twin-arginine translocation signal domain-containing protein [Amycolatopsis arida]